jgi:citrate lyase alpha subunit
MAQALQRKYAKIEAEAERLGVNPRTIRRRIADGTINKGYRFGRQGFARRSGRGGGRHAATSRLDC